MAAPSQKVGLFGLRGFGVYERLKKNGEASGSTQQEKNPNDTNGGSCTIGVGGDGGASQKESGSRSRRAAGRKTYNAEEYRQQVSQVIPGTVLLVSGCKDDQTSADVANTASFGLDADAGPGGAGGACTNSMIKALQDMPTTSWISLLRNMRTILKQKRYTQIPQLSSSHEKDMNDIVSFGNPNPSGRHRALLIGINYAGTSSALKGCHNDVETMRRYLLTQGYEEGVMRILLDDGRHEQPSRANIVDAMRWLVEGAAQGDSLFCHYSGHGTQVKDTTGTEKDGLCEAICPVDHSRAGVILDKELFSTLITPLPAESQLVAVMDCCHSCSVLDLPYTFKSTQDALDEALKNSKIKINPKFDLDATIEFVKENPRLCAGAAIVGGIAYVAMGAENRRIVNEVALAGLTGSTTSAVKTFISEIGNKGSKEQTQSTRADKEGDDSKAPQQGRAPTSQSSEPTTSISTHATAATMRSNQVGSHGCAPSASTHETSANVQSSQQGSRGDAPGYMPTPSPIAPTSAHGSRASGNASPAFAPTHAASATGRSSQGSSHGPSGHMPTSSHSASTSAHGGRASANAHGASAPTHAASATGRSSQGSSHGPSGHTPTPSHSAPTAAHGGRASAKAHAASAPTHAASATGRSGQGSSHGPSGHMPTASRSAPMTAQGSRASANNPSPSRSSAKSGSRGGRR